MTTMRRGATRVADRFGVPILITSFALMGEQIREYVARRGGSDYISLHFPLSVD